MAKGNYNWHLSICVIKQVLKYLKISEFWLTVVIYADNVGEDEHHR
jgi:hypothetical protein